MDFPFIGGRIKQDVLTQNIARSLKLDLDVKETASQKKAWENVKRHIDNNIAVGLKLDCYYLEYFAEKVHFAGHYVTMYGYDDEYAYVIDAAGANDRAKTSLKSLAEARSAKGPMAGKNLSYTVQKTNGVFDLNQAVMAAIKNNAKDYLNPPISNIGYKGVLKTSKEIKKWFKNSKNIERDFGATAMLMEEAGTGGAIFRNIYRDFLQESFDLLKIEEINESKKLFAEAAKMWTQVSGLFKQTAETKERQNIDEASDVLIEISGKEKAAMELLLEI